MKMTKTTRTACYCLLALISSQCWAELSFREEDPYALPRWEIGLMGSGISMPSYRGSDEDNQYFIPLPYLSYRGEILRADRESVAGRFLRTEHLELDLSLFVAIHDDDPLRDGMPELLPLMFEVGPAVKYYFFRKTVGRPQSFYLEVPVRSAIAAEWDSDRDGSPLDLDRVGLSSRLNVYYENDRLFDSRRLSLILGAALAFGDDELHSYYYDVLPSQATASRPEYESGGGYGGFSFSGNLLTRVTPSFAVRLYARWDNIDGAVFEDSPLVSTSNNVTGGIIFMWRLFKSDLPAVD